MEYPNFVYKVPGLHQCAGGTYSFKPVNGDDELNAAIADGWFMSIVDAQSKVEYISDAPPTREELEVKAAELGIKFDGRTTDKKLLSLIAEKVA